MYSVRQPRAAGIFYNSDKTSLSRDIGSFYASKGGPGEPEGEDPVAVITPHDKYILCGGVCAWSFAKLERSNYIIIGPNHMENGAGFSVMKEGLWKTPLGEIVVSNRVSEDIMDRCEFLEYDVNSHNDEHSIEVQLPFLQQRFGNDFKIVPISVRNKFDDEEFAKSCRALGRAVAQSILTQDEKWTIIATTDMSSGKKSEVEKVDASLINSIKNLNEKKFFDAVHRNESYICGYGAVLVALAAAKELKAKRSRLLKYVAATDTTKPRKVSVGYASILVK